jgi:hypothetical protein
LALAVCCSAAAAADGAADRLVCDAMNVTGVVRVFLIGAAPRPDIFRDNPPDMEVTFDVRGGAWREKASGGALSVSKTAGSSSASGPPWPGTLLPEPLGAVATAQGRWTTPSEDERTGHAS